MHTDLSNPKAFAAALFPMMKRLCPALEELVDYEFRYCLDNLTPPAGWASVQPEPQEQIERRVNDMAFYQGIEIKGKVDGAIVLDPQIARLTAMLFAGLVRGDYSEAWVGQHFFFDGRGFIFCHRTAYFTAAVIAHLNGKPYRRFEAKQRDFERRFEVSYKACMEANAEVDAAFIDSVRRIFRARGAPMLLAIAGQTAAGKTEIVERLRAAFEQDGLQTTSVELDNFLTDREGREAKGIHTQGKEAFHLGLMQAALEDLTRGRAVQTPRYDFIDGSSSHSDDGLLKPGRVAVDVAPADIIFIEGNMPFLIPEVAPLVGVKVLYLTDDPVRIKRKWRRDIDFRRKYDVNYYRNRAFKDQFIMAALAYRPQLEICDLAVDTSGAMLWATAEMTALLEGA